MRRSVRRLLASLLVLPLTVAGCTVGPSDRPPLAVYGAPTTRSPATTTLPPTSAPTGPGGPGRAVEPIEWTDCFGDVPDTGPGGASFVVECASVEVPLRYESDPTSTFQLEVARAAPSGQDPAAPVLVVVSGSPGQNGRTRVAAVAESLPESIRKQYAVVTLDVRGTGESQPARCIDARLTQTLIDLPPDPSEGDAADRLVEIARALTFTCTDEVGPALSYLDTTASADDLDNLRAALGTPTLTFLGSGAGATLGAVYADRYPARVGRMVLDGPSDPMASPSEVATARGPLLNAALDAFGGACPDFPGGCPLGDDPVSAVSDLLTSLDELPRTSSQGLLVDAGTVLLALADGLGDVPGWPELATALGAATRQDVQPLADLIVEQNHLDSDDNLFNGRIVYGCNDAAQRLPPAEAATAAGALPDDDIFGRYLLGTVSLCSSWPAPEHPLGRVSAAGAAPMLVLGSVQDPTLPYDGVEALAGQLDPAVLVSWQSGQHGAYPASSCVGDIVDGYLLDGSMPNNGILCPP